MSDTIYKIDSEYKFDNKDDRDFIFTSDVKQEDLPSLADLREYAGNIENQGRTGSCVANATVSALEILLSKAGNFVDLSRLFLYYNLREPYMHLKGRDIGSYTRDGFKMVYFNGIPKETTWPFTVSKIHNKPTDKSYEEASDRMVGEYRAIYNISKDKGITHMKIALAQGYPILIGMKLGKTFYSIKGSLDTHDYPGLQDDSIGGHAMCIVGYDDELDGFIVENSWGKAWGDDGYCLIKYDVIKADCKDVWVCTEFAGVSFKPEWVNSEPVLKVAGGNPKHFKKDGNVFTLEPTIEAGVPPYKYNWRTMAFYHEDVLDFKVDGSKCVATIADGTEKPSKGLLVCRIEDSSIAMNASTVYFNCSMASIAEEEAEAKKIEEEQKKILEEKKIITTKKDKNSKIIILGIAITLVIAYAYTVMN